MTLDLGRLLSRSFSISWRHRWLWVLGVFGGGAGGSFSYSQGSGNGGSGSQQVGDFIQNNLGLIIAVAVIVLLVILALFVIGCIAVPGSIWAGVMLDSGREVTLGQAWRFGRSRFWAFLRLALLKLAIVLGLILVLVVLVGLGIGLYSTLGPASLWAIIPLGILTVLATVAALLLLGLSLAWCDRTLVLLGLGAIDAIRSSIWLFRHHKLDTFVFALVFGLVIFGVDLGLIVGAVILAIPGVLVLVAGIAAQQLAITIVGVLLILSLAGGFYLVGAGFVGSVTQVGYALACRDLCTRHGMTLVVPDVSEG
jgi:hypothetical protein